MADRNNDIGKVCGHAIKVTIFKGTDFCSVNCEKAAKGEAVVPTNGG